MTTAAQAAEFTLQAHRLAVERLRADADAVVRALATLRRWRDQRGATLSDGYLDAWERLLHAGPAAVQEAVCCEGEPAATLRNVSPLGFLLTPDERRVLLRAGSEGPHATH